MKTVYFNGNGRYAYLETVSATSKMKDLFSYSVPGARYTPQFRMKLWNGKRSLMDRDRVSMGLLRGMKEELLKSDVLVKLRTWKNRPKIATKTGFKSVEADYLYQNDCVNKMIKALPWGGGLVLSATGTGKTKMAAQFFSWLDCQILFVVDQLDLLYQSKKEIEFWLQKEMKSNEEVGVVGNSEFTPKKITVATIQTLHKKESDPAFRNWFRNVDVVVIDEVHVQMSRRNFSVLDKIKPKAVYGLTATLQIKQKHIRLKAFSICGPIIYEFPVNVGMDAGVLSTGVAVQVHIPDTKFDDYDDAVVDNRKVNEAIAKFAQAAIAEKYAVVGLVERRKHLFALKKLLINEEPMICAGKVKIKTRQKRVAKLESGEKNLILATRVFKKGVNIKRADMALDCAQLGNKNDVLQKFGRILRLHSEKKGAIYFDFVTALPDVKKTKLNPKFDRYDKNSEKYVITKKKASTVKAGARRLNALKKAGILVKKVTMKDTSVKEVKRIINIAEELLDEALNGKPTKKQKASKQLKLF